MKELRKRLSDSWNDSRAYLGAVGISGIFAIELSNRVARILDVTLAEKVRIADAHTVARVISPLIPSMQEANSLTGEGHTDFERAAVALRLLLVAIDDFLALTVLSTPRDVARNN